MKELSELGLPIWVLVVIAILYTLKQVGVFDLVKNRVIDTSEHKQRGQSDSLASSLDILNRLVDNIIATNNGRLSKVEERLSLVVGIVRSIEAQQKITNRDWSRLDEVLGDIDMILHEIRSAQRTILNGEDNKRGV